MNLKEIPSLNSDGVHGPTDMLQTRTVKNVAAVDNNYVTFSNNVPFKCGFRERGSTTFVQSVN